VWSIEGFCGLLQVDAFSFVRYVRGVARVQAQKNSLVTLNWDRKIY